MERWSRSRTGIRKLQKAHSENALIMVKLNSRKVHEKFMNS